MLATSEDAASAEAGLGLCSGDWELGRQGSSKRHCRGSWAGDEQAAQSRTFYTWGDGSTWHWSPRIVPPRGPQVHLHGDRGSASPIPASHSPLGCAGHPGNVCILGPPPPPRGADREDRTRHGSLEDGHTDRSPSQPWSPSYPPQAGKGVKQGANVPAPPVPLHTGLLLLQHKAGDRQYIEEDHAHDVGDGVPLVLQALLEPAQSRRSVPGSEKAAWLLSQTTRPHYQPGDPRIPAPVKPQLSHCTGESGWLILWDSLELGLCTQ